MKQLKKNPNKKALTTIFLIVFIDLVGFGLILPLLPFIAEEFGANPLQIGLLVAIYSLFQFISAPILGRLSDRFGRKKLLIISQIGSAIGFLLLGMANSLTLLFASRIIDGITGGNISIAQAYIADVTTPKTRARGMGLIGAAFGLGFIIGPALSGLLSQISFSAPAYFASLTALLTAGLTAKVLKETVNTSKASKSPRTRLNLEQFKKVFSLYPIGILIVVFFFTNFSLSTLQGTFALWTERSFGFGPAQTGWLFAYVGVVSVVVQLKLLPALINKYKEVRVLKAAQLIFSLGLLILGLAAHPLVLIAVMPMIATGNGLSNPTIQALASENVKPQEYGEVLGILQSAGSLGRIIGPVLGGMIFYLVDKDMVFFISSGLLLLVYFYTKKNLTSKS